jgi:hypothetical protein
LRTILEEEGSVEDKANRIISIDDERQNEQICDLTVERRDPKECAEEICRQLHLL